MCYNVNVLENVDYETFEEFMKMERHQPAPPHQPGLMSQSIFAAFYTAEGTEAVRRISGLVPLTPEVVEAIITEALRFVVMGHPEFFGAGEAFAEPMPEPENEQPMPSRRPEPV